MDTLTPVFLYVEDDFLSRKVMEMMIKLVMGYQSLTVFDNSADFEMQLAALPEIPNVILLDVQIGPLDGYQMLKLLRQNEQFAHSTIIAMTANVMSHDVEALQRAGFDGLIGKPVLKDIVPELINRVLAGEQVWYVP
jgi:CheY-like chemotaxis protein